MVVLRGQGILVSLGEGGVCRVISSSDPKRCWWVLSTYLMRYAAVWKWGRALTHQLLHVCREWCIKSERQRECKCQWVVFPPFPWPVAPFDLSSRASHYSATLTPSLLKAAPCALAGAAQTNSWRTLCHLRCHITGRVTEQPWITSVSLLINQLKPHAAWHTCMHAQQSDLFKLLFCVSCHKNAGLIHKSNKLGGYTTVAPWTEPWTDK